MIENSMSEILKGENNLDKALKYATIMHNVGDVFMYLANICHEIHNTGNIESEYIFIRIHK